METTNNTIQARFAGLPTRQFPAVGGKWPAPAGTYLDHTDPACQVAAFYYYVETGTPVSKFAELAGFQHSGVLKRALNRTLKAAGHPSFTRQAVREMLDQR